MENHIIKANIIDQQTLEKLQSVKNKTVKNIICYLWINQINPENTISVIDAIEFNFSDNDQLTLTGNESQEGLTVLDEYNFEEQKSFLEKEFQNKIKLYKVDASATKMWETVVSKKIINIQLSKDKVLNQYLSDQMIFEFEDNEMRLIQVHPIDGIILDFYEEI